jgi:hypothetical protein
MKDIEEISVSATRLSSWREQKQSTKLKQQNNQNQSLEIEFGVDIQFSYDPKFFFNEVSEVDNEIRQQQKEDIYDDNNYQNENGIQSIFQCIVFVIIISPFILSFSLSHLLSKYIYTYTYTHTHTHTHTH